MYWQKQVFVLLLVGLASVSSYPKRDEKVSDEEFLIKVNDNKHYKVDFFVLATEWPQGTCEWNNATHHHKCVVPSSVNGWVLHGLWPSTNAGGGRKHLGYCNNTVKFDYNKVKDLRADLDRYWPNLFAGTSSQKFWKHEYEKHGTCAALVKGFETEHIYFSRAMEILQKFDPAQVLKKADIVPSKDAYPADRIIRAANQGYGVNVCPQCSYSRGVRTISGLEVCLTNQMELMDCPHDCWRKFHCSGDIAYHPLHFEN